MHGYAESVSTRVDRLEAIVGSSLETIYANCRKVNRLLMRNSVVVAGAMAITRECEALKRRTSWELVKLSKPWLCVIDLWECGKVMCSFGSQEIALWASEAGKSLGFHSSVAEIMSGENQVVFSVRIRQAVPGNKNQFTARVEVKLSSVACLEFFLPCTLFGLQSLLEKLSQ